jgi:hypothetical protein
MRSKNIFSPLLCYFILTAFLGCMTFEFMRHSEMSSQKVQQLSTKTSDNFDLSFLFEEDEEGNDTIGFDLLHYPSPISQTPVNFQCSIAFNRNTVLSDISIQTSTPLFIHQRTLRI